MCISVFVVPLLWLLFVFNNSSVLNDSLLIRLSFLNLSFHFVSKYKFKRVLGKIKTWTCRFSLWSDSDCLTSRNKKMFVHVCPALVVPEITPLAHLNVDAGRLTDFNVLIINSWLFRRNMYFTVAFYINRPKATCVGRRRRPLSCFRIIREMWRPHIEMQGLCQTRSFRGPEFIARK